MALLRTFQYTAAKMGEKRLDVGCSAAFSFIPESQNMLQSAQRLGTVRKSGAAGVSIRCNLPNYENSRCAFRVYTSKREADNGRLSQGNAAVDARYSREWRR